MSRSAQFIGLTKTAQEYVKDLEEVESISYANGIAGEKIPLKRWKVSENIVGIYHLTFITEILQEAPWSSGPMIFTCLSWDIKFPKKTDYTPFLEWIHDPGIKDQEFDQEKGALWI